MRDFVLKKQKGKWVLLIWCSLALICCSSSAENVEMVDAQTISIRGEITPETYSEFRQLVKRKNPSRLIITSSGGDIPTAIAIGQLVHHNEMKVAVHGVCLSACAHYVLMSAPEIFIFKGSVIGFHHSQSAANSVIGQEHLTETSVATAALEVEHYTALNLDTDWLLIPLEKLDPTCIVDPFTYQANRSFNIRKRYKFYVPSIYEFTLIYNGTVEGHWPTAADVEQLEYNANLPPTYFIYNSMVRTPLDDIRSCE